MRKLYLIRHAKSTWEHDGVHDMDRPLKGRGIRDAYSASLWLLEQGEKAEKVYSSPATRALHTALIFCRELHFPFTDIEIVADLYDASPSDIAAVVNGIPDSCHSAMLFAHNPGITTYLNQRIDHRVDNVPTTGIACLNFSVSKWSEIGKDEQADLLFFDYPKRRKK